MRTLPSPTGIPTGPIANAVNFLKSLGYQRAIRRALHRGHNRRYEVPRPCRSQIHGTPNALDDSEHDLKVIGGPPVGIKPNPAMFVALVRTQLRVQGPQVADVELYDIEPWASDCLHPIYDLVFDFS